MRRFAGVSTWDGSRVKPWARVMMAPPKQEPGRPALPRPNETAIDAGSPIQGDPGGEVTWPSG